MRKRVLCITYGGGHVNIVKTIYPEINKETEIDFTLLALTLADESLEKANIPHKTISDYINMLPYKKKIMEYGRLTNPESNNKIKEKDTLAYFGIGYYDLVEKFGEKEAQSIYKKEGRKAFCPVQTMTKILEYEKPDVLLLTTGARFCKAAGYAANAAGIKLVMIDDFPDIKIKEFSSIRCVMNKHIKDKLMKISDTTEKVVVTGQPVFEKNTEICNVEKENYERVLKKKHTKLIVYLGQGEPELMENAIETVGALHKIAYENEDILILVRPHPNASKGYGYYELENYIESKKGELKYILDISDLVITHFSTAGLEAALLDKPVITVNNEDMPNILNNLGIATPVYHIDDLRATIENLLDKSSREYESLAESRKKFGNEPNATKNIIELVKE